MSDPKPYPKDKLFGSVKPFIMLSVENISYHLFNLSVPWKNQWEKVYRMHTLQCIY